MDQSQLIKRITEFGALVPELFHRDILKTDTYMSPENKGLVNYGGERGLEILQEYAQRLTHFHDLGLNIARTSTKDLSLRIAGLFLAAETGIIGAQEERLRLTLELFNSIRELTKVTDSALLNNFGFAFDHLGYCRDPSKRPEELEVQARSLGLQDFGVAERLYEESGFRNRKLWQPRYNLAVALREIHLGNRTPEQKINEEILGGIVYPGKTQDIVEKNEREIGPHLARALRLLHQVINIDPDNILAREEMIQFYTGVINPVVVSTDILDIDNTNILAQSVFDNLSEIVGPDAVKMIQTEIRNSRKKDTDSNTLRARYL